MPQCYVQLRQRESILRDQHVGTAFRVKPAIARQLARCRARAVPASSRAACTSALALRWSAVLSIAAARVFAASLLGPSLAGEGNVDGNLPLMSDLLADSSEVLPFASRAGFGATFAAFHHACRPTHTPRPMSKPIA